MAVVREASFNDFGDIMALIGRNGLGVENKSLEEWGHLWRNNPVIVNSKIEWPIGWVLENNDSQIVGFFGNIPVEYEFKQKRLIVAVANSWVVDAAYRNHSMLLISSYFNQKTADIFLNTSASYLVGRIFLSFFKAKKIPVELYDTTLFWIIDYQSFISSAMLKKGLPSSNVITFPVSLAMRSIDKLIRRNPYMTKFNRKVFSLTSFDERFDIFWENLRKRQNGFIGVRDSHWLNWHFKYAIMHRKIWIFVAGTKSSITSYAIFLRQDNPKIGLRRIRLIDFQTIDDDLTVLMEMIACGIKRCRKESIHTLEVVGFNSEKRNIVKEFAPHRRRLIDWLFLYKTRDKLLAKELEDSNLWDPCFFDGDASL